MLVVNCKNYPGAQAGLGGLLEAAAGAAERHGVRVAVAPPQHLLGSAAGRGVPVMAQHADDAAPGGTTGFVVPELLAEAGVAGALLNHSEHRIPAEAVGALVPRLRKLGMVSIVCARDAAEVGELARLGPDYVAVEPPELIGTGRSVSSHRPGLVREAAEAAGARARLLCGAGITSGADAARALELGAEGVLVASGVVRSADPGAAISERAGSMV